MIGDFIKKPCPYCGAPGRIVPSISTDPIQEREGEYIAGIAQCSNKHKGYYFTRDDMYKYLIPPDK